MILVEMNFKEKSKKNESSKYNFTIKELVALLIDKYDLSKEDSMIICEKLLELGWIESLVLDEKRMKETSFFKLVKNKKSQFFFLIFDLSSLRKF